MSANNQTLVKEYEDKFYVFSNVNAESWWDEDRTEDDQKNYMTVKEAFIPFDTLEEALEFAYQIDQDSMFGGTEYGVQINTLAKDGADVSLIKE